MSTLFSYFKPKQENKDTKKSNQPPRETTVRKTISETNVIEQENKEPPLDRTPIQSRKRPSLAVISEDDSDGEIGIRKVIRCFIVQF